MAKRTPGPASKPTHYIAHSMRERVRLAFTATLLEHHEYITLGVTAQDLHNVQMIAERQSQAIQNIKIDAYKTRRTVNVSYFNEILTESIKVVPSAGDLEKERLDLYKTIVRRAFAWKKGKIPIETYKKVMLCHPWFMHMLKLPEVQQQLKLL